VYLSPSAHLCCECGVETAFSVETVHTRATCILVDALSYEMIHRAHVPSEEKGSWLTQEFHSSDTKCPSRLRLWLT